jgi:DNA-binding IclR family transcriptional regulator
VTGSGVKTDPAVAVNHRSSLVRGLQIIDIVAAAGPLRIGEIAARADLPPSTVYRYVRFLREARYLVEIDGTLTLGSRFGAGERRETGHLVRLAEPVLRKLREETAAAAILTVRVQTTALCLDRIMPQRRVQLSFQRGAMRPLYAGASATALLAWAPQEIIDKVTSAPIRKITANTREKSDLIRELAVIREQGFAISFGEADPEMAAIAAPAFRAETCVCALSIAAARAALPAPKLDAAVSSVVRAAAELSRRLDSVDGALAWAPGDESTLAGAGPGHLAGSPSLTPLRRSSPAKE